MKSVDSHMRQIAILYSLEYHGPQDAEGLSMLVCERLGLRDYLRSELRDDLEVLKFKGLVEETSDGVERVIRCTYRKVPT